MQTNKNVPGNYSDRQNYGHNNISIDKDQLKALGNLDDRQFSQLIYNAIINAGGNTIQAKAAMSAAPIIKSKLKNAGDKELEQLIKLIGKDNASKILNDFKSASNRGTLPEYEGK